MANATGCSSIYGGNLPTTPWAKNKEGRGPAWSNSLFEDNAEFGLGFRLALDLKQQYAQHLVGQFAGQIGDELAGELLHAKQDTEEEINAELAGENVKINYNGVTTFCGASHWQFVAWKKVLQEFLPIDLTKPMGQVLRLDQMVNEHGYLRLMTDKPYVMNMSNTVELPGAPTSKTEKKPKKRLVDYPLIKSPLMRIYNAIFGLYYKNER